MTQRNPWLWSLAAGALWLAACDRPPAEEPSAPEQASGPLRVLAVNEPLACFARRIGIELVDARCPAPAGEDPAYWEPDDDELVEIQRADLILLNGAGYAHWVETASLSPSKLVDTSAGFRDRLIETEGTSVHSHGPEGEHSHGQTAFTTWLDLDLACRHADAVLAALRRALPEHDEGLQQRHAVLVDELRDLDEALDAWGASLEGSPILTSHPVYQYLARAYGLAVESVHWEPGEMPPDEQWKGLEALVERHPAAWMLWEGPPSPETAVRLESLGVHSVVFDPCGGPHPGEDFLSVLQANLERLRAAGCGAF